MMVERSPAVILVFTTLKHKEIEEKAELGLFINEKQRLAPLLP